MGYIFQAQTKLRITLSLGIDISGCTCKIKYQKPSGAVGYWNASVLGSTTNGVIYYDVYDATILNETGTWKLWSYVTFNDGKYAPGKSSTMKVYKEGA